MSAEQVRRIEELARDFAQVWDAATDHVGRKRMLRLLVGDPTLVREGCEVRLDPGLRGGKGLGLGPVKLNRPRHLSMSGEPISPEK